MARTVHLAARVEPALAVILERAARDSDRSVSAIVREACWAWIAAQTQRRPGATPADLEPAPPAQMESERAPAV